MTISPARSPRSPFRLAGRAIAFVAIAVALALGAGSPAGADDGYGPVILPVWIAFGTDQVPNANGWFNRPVEATFICADPDGVVTCPDDVVMTEGLRVPISSTDQDGRTTSATFGPLPIDQTPPRISIVNNGATFRHGQSILLGCDVSDDLSGLEWVSNPCPAWGRAASDLSAGTHYFEVQATDRAGNTSSAVAVVTIVK